MEGEHAAPNQTAPSNLEGPVAVSSLQRRVLALLALLAIAVVVLFGLLDAYADIPGPSWAPVAGLGTMLGVLALGGHLILQPAVDDVRERVWDLESSNVELAQNAQERIEEIEQYAFALERSNEDLERFAQAASHDLREPVRMINAYLQLIEDRYGDRLDKEAEEYFEYAITGAQRLDTLITGLLDYATTGGETQTAESVDLNLAVEDARSNLKLAIDETNATINHERLPTVRGRRAQLAQVFQNLIENAIKFRGETDPHVTIRSVEDGDTWIIYVEDDGIGFDSEREGRIFDIFQRGSSQQAGPGIGLAICKRIIEYHRGEIWAEAQPGEGATFAFRLPKPSASPAEEPFIGKPKRPESLEERSNLLI